MKPNPEPENHTPMREVLREWVVDAALPPRFQEQVWQRIARSESEAQRGFMTVLVRWVESAFQRPALAFSYVGLLLVVGLSAGYRQAQDTSERAESQWRALYVQSVDPYQMPRH